MRSRYDVACRVGFLKHNLNIANLNFKLKMAHSLHHQNNHTVEIEMLKIHHGFSKVSFLHLFHNCNESNFLGFDLNPIQYESPWYFGPGICNNIPIEIKRIKNLTHLIQKSENGNQNLDFSWVIRVSRILECDWSSQSWVWLTKTNWFGLDENFLGQYQNQEPFWMDMGWVSNKKTIITRAFIIQLTDKIFQKTY